MLWLLAYCFSNSSLLTVVECQKSLWRSPPLPLLINSLFPQAGVILGVKRASKCTCKPPLLCIHIVETRTNCSRKFLEMKSGSWQSWLGPSLGWQGWQVIICKRQVLLDDHLQKAGLSGWSFARGRYIQMILCKRLATLDDYLQEANNNNNRVTGVTTGEGTEGGEESVAVPRTHGPTKGSTGGPRGPNYFFLSHFREAFKNVLADFVR